MKTLVEEAYTIMCSVEPSQFRAVRDAPNSLAKYYQEMLYGSIQDWRARYIHAVYGGPQGCDYPDCPEHPRDLAAGSESHE